MSSSPPPLMTREQIDAGLKAASDSQINAVDFASGPRIMTIRGVRYREDPKRPWVIMLAGEKLPWLPCVSMRRLLHSMWGDPSAAWLERRVELYCDPEVPFGEGKNSRKVGGIRILAADAPSKPDHVIQTGRGKNTTFTVRTLPPATAAPDRLADALRAAGWYDDAVAEFGERPTWDDGAVKAWASARKAAQAVTP